MAVSDDYLITLMLCEEKALHEPLLYFSLYFKRHRERYYELSSVCSHKGRLGELD